MSVETKSTMTVGGIVALIAPPASPETANSATGEPAGSAPSDTSREHLPRAAKDLRRALGVVSALTSGSGVWLIFERPSSGLAFAAFVTGAFFFLAAVVVPLGITREICLERDEASSCEDDCQRLEASLPADDEHGLQRTLQNLTVANFRQMRTFTAIAQRQARMSYYASLLGAGLSLLVLLAGAAVAVGVPSVAGKIAAGSLAAVGTALSAFLSKTFLRAYDMGLHQMSYYYGQPLVHCYLYLAEWQTLLAPPEVDDQTKRELYQEVVRASLRASANAQHHLLSLHEHDAAGRRGGSFRQLMSPPGFNQPHPAAAAADDLLTVTLRT